MIIFMTHPVHGAMHCYLEAEAIENEKNGWVRQPEPAPEPETDEASKTLHLKKK